MRKSNQISVAVNKGKCSNVTVIIRSAYERTEALCSHLIKQQVDEKNVIVIHERPFSTAVRRSFELGVDYNLDWTLCVDADVLVASTSISALISSAKRHPTTLFSIQGHILDRLFNRFRPGGLHLYRTSLLPLVLQQLEITPNVIRPEGHIKTQMQDRGFSVSKSALRVGLHDYYQYYKDIFRKAFVHAYKHAERLELVPMWRYLSKLDKDFVIALEGWYAGQCFTGNLKMDVATLPNQINHILSKYGLVEGQPITQHDLLIDIDDYMVNGSPEYNVWQHYQQRIDIKLISQWQRLGPRRFFTWLLGIVARRSSDL